MEPTQAKPVKIRRRWLIVALVLVLVSLCSWWYWPRGDTRFVGKWSIAIEGEPKPYGTWRLRRNGTGYYTDTSMPHGGGSGSMSMRWATHEGKFMMADRSEYATMLEKLAFRLEELIRVPVGEMRPLDVLSIESDEIRVRNNDSPNPRTLVLRRVPE